MRLPAGFPADVESEALGVSDRPPSEGRARRTPRLDIDFLTIDPPGSKDLDQAFHGSIAPGGYRIRYAIADLGHFIDPGSALDHESGVRGKTLYCPDLSVPLYPPTISEGAGSLLPGQLKPAVLWSFDLDREGIVRRTSIERAVIRSSRQLTYHQAQDELDSGTSHAALRVLKEVGTLRLKLEEQRGGIDLKLPDQQVHRTAGGFELTYREELPIEAWNAQISLMTGMAAAAVMLEGRVGLLRTLPQPDHETIQMLRLSAEALDLRWPPGTSYQRFIRSLSPGRPREAALLSAARVLFRGAGYTFFHGEAPLGSEHNTIAAPYAHVTAPLRRMADRLTNEVALCLAARSLPPEWMLKRLAEAPEIMRSAHHIDRELESRIVDYVESEILKHRVGEIFDAVVVQSGEKAGMVQLKDPAVLGPCKGAGLPLGQRMAVVLTEADPHRGRIHFAPAGPL